jgi:hypothetical protein
VQGASPWAVVLIPSDILGWTVYPTIYITLDAGVGFIISGVAVLNLLSKASVH